MHKLFATKPLVEGLKSEEGILSIKEIIGYDTSSTNKELPDRFAAIALASGIRTSLLLHQQLGIEWYPLLPALRQALAEKRGKKSVPGSIKMKPSFSPPLPPKKSSPLGTTSSAHQLASLHRDIQSCQLCALPTTCQRQVLGTNTGATSRLLIIGDYSRQEIEFSATTLFGAAEDPLLWNMMRAINLTPADVSVTNVIKCCPQAAGQPEEENEQRCPAYLYREIELVRPQIICAMGKTAACALLKSTEPVARLRGKFHLYKIGGRANGGIPVMVTFHPRALLECPDLKKATWHDLQLIQRQLLTLHDTKG